MPTKGCSANRRRIIFNIPEATTVTKIKYHTVEPHIIVATAQNSVTPVFVHPCVMSLHLNLLKPSGFFTYRQV